uniref:Small EDRK-rich factor-like N-terminal domain-containing protein n=1 Tax=Ornithodoros turicata TaxID=34597 RepID=A0A2R5LHH7_9ACAR
MTRGNQRELARAKNIKKQQEHQKKKSATDKDGNRGLTLEERRHRDAEVMRLKQKKATETKTPEGGK